MMHEALTYLVELLGVPAAQRAHVSMPSDIEPMIREGFSPDAVMRLVQALAVPAETIAPVLGLSAVEFGRLKRRRRRLGLVLSDRVYRVAAILARASVLLGNQERAVLWLRTPNQVLGGQTPWAKLATEIGTACVDKVLRAVEIAEQDKIIAIRPVARQRRSLEELIAATPSFDRLQGWLD